MWWHPGGLDIHVCIHISGVDVTACTVSKRRHTHRYIKLQICGMCTVDSGPVGGCSCDQSCTLKCSSNKQRHTRLGPLERALIRDRGYFALFIRL